MQALGSRLWLLVGLCALWQGTARAACGKAGVLVNQYSLGGFQTQCESLLASPSRSCFLYR